MKILRQIQRYNLSLVAVHKIGKIFVLFCQEAIYLWGEEKELIKFQKEHK